jgi:hypothetical protein
LSGAKTRIRRKLRNPHKHWLNRLSVHQFSANSGSYRRIDFPTSRFGKIPVMVKNGPERSDRCDATRIRRTGASPLWFGAASRRSAAVLIDPLLWPERVVPGCTALYRVIPPLKNYFFRRTQRSRAMNALFWRNPRIPNALRQIQPQNWRGIWLPMPATIQLPHKSCALRASWSHQSRTPPGDGPQCLLLALLCAEFPTKVVHHES